MFALFFFGFFLPIAKEQNGDGDGSGSNIRHATWFRCRFFSLANFQNIYGEMLCLVVVSFSICSTNSFFVVVVGSNCHLISFSYWIYWTQFTPDSFIQFMSRHSILSVFCVPHMSGISAVICSFSRTLSLLVISKRNNNRAGEKNRH